ncbi:chaplin family protein [Streptomyces sp. NPDC057302]|uniref:chaplin n=1 Tax=Streptomyces sp. NPDC057302 TaxID=3346094 RepID=UPI00362A30FA
MRQVIGKGILATAAATSILSLSGSSAFAAGADAVATDSPGILSGNSVQAPVEVPVNACGNTADAAAGLNPAFGNSCANAGSSPKAHTSAPDRSSTHGRPAPRTDHGSGHGSGHGTGHGYGDTSDSDGGHPGGHSGSHPGGNPDSYPGTHAGTQSVAQGDATHSPGVLTGNNAQAPADVPVNACGNTVDVIALLNPVFGNSCANGAPAPTPPQHETPPSPQTPPRVVQPPTDRAIPPVKPGQPPRHVDSSTSRQVSSPVAAPEAPRPVAQLAETGSDQDLMAAAAASAALLIGGGILYRRGRASSGV